MYPIRNTSISKNKEQETHFSTTQSKNFLAPHYGQSNVSKYSRTYTLKYLGN